MADEIGKPLESFAERFRGGVLPPALIAQSAASGLVSGYAEVARLSATYVREQIDEMDRCIRAMSDARDPIGIAACYSTFLFRLAERGVEQTTVLGGVLLRTGAAVATAQPDGSRPAVMDQAD